VLTRARRIPGRLGAAYLLAALVAAGAGLPARAADDHKRVAIVVSWDGEAYDDALKGFEKALRREGLQVRPTIYRLKGDSSLAGESAGQARLTFPDLVFALGALGTSACQREITNVPIVAGMVPSRKDLEGPNITGVCLDVPLDTQLRRIRDFVPSASSVGIVYRSGDNEDRIMSVYKAAQSLKLRLEARRVAGPEAVEGAFKSLAGHIDVLLAVYEPVLMTPDCARKFLLFGMQSEIPVVGLSSTWVKAGALYSLECDYADLGDQCGAIAAQILRGASPSSIPPSSPRRLTYSINVTTRDRLHANVSESLLAGAAKTYEAAQ
jgi:putative ABC transport system substrate-binding protein